MIQKLKFISEALQNAPSLLISKKVSAGFDGFVDSIVKVINHKTEDTEPVFFRTIEEFGNYISGKKGSGFSLETEELFQKLGGNMPIMANAMAKMNTSVNCIGAFGLPSIVPAFLEMDTGCNLFSYTNPGFTTAMEFADGKIMLAQMKDLNQADWSTIKNALSLEKITKIFNNSDLICLVNWSELDHSNNIWEGMLQEVFAPKAKESKQKHFFFDLSDCSKRSPDAIKSALNLVRQFNQYGKITLSLNKNEANILYETCIAQPPVADLQIMGEKLFSCLNINTLIIHTSKLSLAWDMNSVYRNEPVFINNPKISTGAGDNFNAGFCIANLLGLDAELSLIMANMVSNIYITTGKSPDLATLSAHIRELMTAL